MRLYANRPIGTVPRARQLRRDASEPERRLLRALRETFPAHKWRHQVPVGPFYADILCFSEALVIEVDGDTHVDTAGRDAARTAAIAREGLRVMRFSNDDVTQNLDGVIATIASSLSHGDKGEGRKVRAVTMPSPSHAATRRGPLPLPKGEGQ